MFFSQLRAWHLRSCVLSLREQKEPQVPSAFQLVEKIVDFRVQYFDYGTCMFMQFET